MWTFIWMLFIGLVVGALAKLIMPGKDPGGIFITMLLGIAGALVAGFIGRMLGLYASGQRAGFINVNTRSDSAAGAVSTYNAPAFFDLNRLFRSVSCRTDS